MSRPAVRRAARVPIWLKLAMFGTVGVVLTHAAHLVIGNRVSSRALVQAQERFGEQVAHLLADAAADPVLIDDRLALRRLLESTLSEQSVAYVIVATSGDVLASTFGEAPPRTLLLARPVGDLAPLTVVSSEARYLELAHPILEGRAGVVRVGMDLSTIEATRFRVSTLLGLLALSVIVLGAGAAYVVGKAIARPATDLVAAVDRFDPARDSLHVERKSSDELGELTLRFNQMMARLKSAHDETARAREQEAETERMAVLGTLMAGVAHEVNNPVAGMKSCLRRLQREEDLPGHKREEYLELMEEGLERIEDVMQRLLDVTRPRPLALAEILVREIMREGASLLRPTLARRQITLKEEDADVVVVADRRQAAQGLLNLLLNAAYVTKDGGEIRMRTRQRPGLCGISVEDDGPGVPSELRERILDPFFTTKPGRDGTGLGLSVTQSIAEAHGGDLTLEWPACGTIATLWVRLAAPEAGSSPDPSTA